MERVTMILVSAAMLCAAVLPAGTPDRVYVLKVEKPQPAMWVECSQQMKVERERICRSRAKAI